MDSPKPTAFAISSNAITTYEAWESWKRGLQYYLDSKDIKNPIRRKAMLLYRGGEGLQKIYATLEIAHADEILKSKDQYATALNLLDKHFRPTVNRIFERWNFRQIRQGSDSLEQFVVRLRHQAEYCSFTNVEEAIVDQIVDATSNAEFRKQILEKRLCSLDPIIELGKLIESVNIQAHSIASSNSAEPSTALAAAPFSLNPTTSESVALLSDRSSNTRSGAANQSSRCSRCGARGHTGDSPECRAREGTCFRCQRKGHFANRCRAPRDRSNSRRRSSRRRSPSPRPKEDWKGSGRSRHDVRAINEADDDSDEGSGTVFRVMSITDNSDDNHVIVQLGGVSLKVLVDSGASCNVLDWKSWLRLKSRGIDFVPGTVSRKIYPYGETTPLNIAQAVIVKIRALSVSFWGKFYVLADSTPLPSRYEPILGSRTAKRLKLLRVGYEEDGKVYAQFSKTSSQRCLLYTSPSPRDRTRSRMPSSA